MPQYRIQSTNTKFYLLNTGANGQKVDTQDGQASVPDNSALRLDTPVGGTPTIVTIKGDNGLYVTLKGDDEGTYLTWSDQEYRWIVSLAHAGAKSFHVTPAEGYDLYWFDEFGVGIGNSIIVKAGKNIKPPQSEWMFMQV